MIVEVKIAPMDTIWLFHFNVAFACHFIATHPSSPSHPIGVLVVLATPVISYLNGEKFSYLSTQWLVNKQTMNTSRMVANFLQASVFLTNLQYFISLKLVFLNIYNCAWKQGFHKCSHNLCMHNYSKRVFAFLNLK